MGVVFPRLLCSISPSALQALLHRLRGRERSRAHQTTQLYQETQVVPVCPCLGQSIQYTFPLKRLLVLFINAPRKDYSTVY